MSATPSSSRALEAKLLAAINRGRGQKLIRDDMYSYLLAEMKKEDPSFTWRSLRRFMAAIRARKALNAIVEEEPAPIVDLDCASKKRRARATELADIHATAGGLLIPWSVINKLKKQFVAESRDLP
jgi:hypothetical protein